MKKLTFMLLMCAVMMFVIGCGGDEPEPTQAVAEAEVEADTPTEVPAPTDEPTNTPEPEPTATALPTNTPEPTATPEPEPTATEEPVAVEYETATFTSDALGLTVDYPLEWIAETFLGLIAIITSDAAVMESNTLDGAAFIGMAMPADGMTLDDAIADAAEQTGLGEDVTFVGDAAEVMIDDKRGLQQSIELDQEGELLLGTLTIVENGEFFSIMMTVSPEDAEDDARLQLDAIVASAELGDPDLEGMLDGFNEDFDTSSSDMDDAPAVDATAGVAVANSLDLASVYDVSLQGDETYLFLATSDREADLVLEISDADGAVIESIDEEFGGDAEFLIWTAPANGEYSVRVANFYSDGFEHVFVYDVVDGLDSAEIGDDPITIELPASTQPQMLLVLPDDEVDLTLDGTLPGIFDAYVDNNSSGEPELLIAPASPDETLRITVDAFFNSAGSFEYKIIALDELFAPLPDPIALLEDAGLFASAEGGLSVQSNTDYTDPAGIGLAFSGSDGDRIAVRVEGDDDFDGLIRIYDQFGDLLLSVDDGFRGDAEVLAVAIVGEAVSGLTIELSNFSTDEAKDYTIAVYHDEGITIDSIEPLEGFDFGIDDSPDVDAIALSEGEVASAFGDVSSFYSVTLSAESAYVFLAVPDADSDIEIEIMIENATRSVDDGFSGESELLTFEPQADGEYLVEVANFSFGEFEHTFAYYAVGLDDAQSAELSDDATSVLVEFEPSAQPHLLIAIPDEALDIVLDGGVPDGINELFADGESGGGTEFLIIPASEDLTVSVDISGFGDATGSFQYIIIELDEAFTPEAAEFTILLDDVEALASDDGLSNQLSNSYEDDQLKQFRASGSQGQRVAVRLEGDDGFDGLIVLSDAGGTQLFSHDDGFVGETELFAVEFTGDEETTLLFDLSEFFGESGEYAITFYYDDGVTVAPVE